MMPFNADGCSIGIQSPFGKLMELSFPMMYCMSQLNDGILTEAVFNMTDEETGDTERIAIRIRVEKVHE